MTDVDLGEKPPPLVPGAHRVIRALDASEGPFVGLLVTRGDAVAVQLEAESLAGWGGWRFAGAEHVAGPVDLVRHEEGHDVLLPWCTERVGSLLARRHAADEPLSLGECSTLVASLLRGLDELADDAATERGDWWLTGEGRPMFAFGEGGDACSRGERIIDQLVEGCRDKAMGRLLASVQVGLRKARAQPRIPRRQVEIWERELFEIATPRPLRCDVHAPERATEVARALRAAPVVAGSNGSTRSGRRSPEPSREATARRSVGARVLKAWRPGAAAAVGAVRSATGDFLERRREGVRHRSSRSAEAQMSGTPSRPRRRSLAVAGVAAVAVLAAGLLWPGSESGEAAEDQTTKESTSRDEETRTVRDTPADNASSPRPSASPHDARGDAVEPELQSAPASAAPGLLAASVVCVEAGDQECEHVMSPGSIGQLARVAEVAATDSAAQLVDEYGDVAVIRLDPSSTSRDADGADVSGHILVLVRSEKKWLVRDVYDVADQPE